MKFPVSFIHKKGLNPSLIDFNRCKGEEINAPPCNVKLMSVNEKELMATADLLFKVERE